MTPFESLLIYDALLLLWMVAWGVYTHWRLDGTLYITFFLLVCGIISTIYYPFADGFVYDYSNITLVPFLYLMLCFLITAYPIMAYDVNGCSAIGENKFQERFLYRFTVFLILVSLEPALENLKLLPQTLGNDAAMDSMYDSRHYTSFEDPLSGVGRKLFRFTSTFSYIIPVLLCYYLSKAKVNYYVVAGLIMCLLSYWIHSVIAGGRSLLVQNLLYIVVVYFLMRRFIPKKLNGKIMIYGSLFIGLGVLGVLAVSIARYNSNSMEADDVSIWLWLGLYAGEGNLNFNSMMWDVFKNTGGESTFIFLLDILGMTRDTTVQANWDAIARLGVPGNIFYTYVGSIFADFGKIGTVVFLAVMSAVVRLCTIAKGQDISLVKIIFICLLARILVLPTFYTYATHISQVDLCITLLFCLAYSLCGRLYIGRRLIF